MKNIIKYELLNTFRDMNTSILISLILITASFVSSFYILSITYFPVDSQIVFIRFVISVIAVFFIGSMFITQLYYYPKINGVFLTYLALGFSLYKLWIIKSLVLLIILYSLFLISFIFSVFIVLFLTVTGISDNITIFGSYLELILFLILGPILGISISAFLEGMIFMLVKDIGSAKVLPNIITISVLVLAIYFLPKFIDFNFLYNNIFYILIVSCIGITVLLIFSPYLIFKLKKIENFIK